MGMNEGLSGIGLDGDMRHFGVGKVEGTVFRKGEGFLICTGN